MIQGASKYVFDLFTQMFLWNKQSTGSPLGRTERIFPKEIRVLNSNAITYFERYKRNS